MKESQAHCSKPDVDTRAVTWLTYEGSHQNTDSELNSEIGVHNVQASISLAQIMC